MIRIFLWRLWKCFLHLVTGKCEIYRLALGSSLIHQKTRSIRNSLMRSRSKTLRDVVCGRVLEVSDALRIIIAVKKIPTDQHQEFYGCVRPCLLRICSTRILFSQVEELRAQSFSKENPKHEQMLLELWKLLCPGQQLEGRLTKQWQDIGFQGNNPATDFRGMGMLGLTCLHSFSHYYDDKARSILLHSQHPRVGYPYAIVVINLTSLTYGWLRDGLLDFYLYRTATQWPLMIQAFTDVVCSVVVQFDNYWRESEPENVMMFSQVREEFSNQFKEKLSHPMLTLTVQ